MVDSSCSNNRHSEHSVVGPLLVLDGHACLRISGCIVLDRYRRVSHAGDIDPQNANRSGRRSRALRVGSGSAITDVQLCEAQSGLTVAFVIPANPDASAAKPLKGFSVATGSHWLSKTGADAVAAHVLEALRKAGLPGHTA